MEPKKCMTVSLDEQVDRIFEDSKKERERARQEVISGRVKGYVASNGDVTIGDAVSSITYRQGCTVYAGW